MNKVLSLLGLATKAGHLVSGELAAETAVKTGNAQLVILAEDASANTEKRFRDKCAYYGVPIVTFGTKEALGHAIGKEFRASLAVTDTGFAKAIQKKLDDSGTCEVNTKK